MNLIVLFFVAFTSLQSFSKDAKPGPRFDYYNLRNKPMKHGLVFKDKGAAKDDDLMIKSASLSNGKEIYSQLCIHCHGSSGEGNGNAAKELVIKPADLSKLSKDFPGYAFFMQISEGSEKGMPSWRDVLTVKEAWDLVAYVKSLSKK